MHKYWELVRGLRLCTSSMRRIARQIARAALYFSDAEKG
jgi:hypothetical protein